MARAQVGEADLLLRIETLLEAWEGDLLARRKKARDIREPMIKTLRAAVEAHKRGEKMEF